MPYVVTSDCNTCGACVAGCESGAVKEGDTINSIDVSMCIECGLCAANCPFGAIKYEDDVDLQPPATKAG
jgi:ferredoxin